MMSVRPSIIVLAAVLASLSQTGDAAAQASDYDSLTGCTVQAMQYSYWPEGNRGDGTVANVEKLWFVVGGCSGSLQGAGITVMTGHPEVGTVRANGNYLVPAAVFERFFTMVKDARQHGYKVSVSGENLRAANSRPYQIMVEATGSTPMPVIKAPPQPPSSKAPVVQPPF